MLFVLKVSMGHKWDTAPGRCLEKKEKLVLALSSHLNPF
jgi:hypothetical protein